MSVGIAAAYIRVSTDDQVEYSPESQISKIKELAKRDGYLVPDEYFYQDDGISGKKAEKRPAFRLMIATAKQEHPPFDRIYVWEFSRFARNQEESIMYKNLLRKKGITVKSVREPLTDSPFSSLIERIIEWMDEYYLINLAAEVRRGMSEKARRGEAMGRAPFGYRVEDKKYVPDENAPLVRYIFESYLDGHNLREIAVLLGEKGIKTANGKLPDIYWINYILRNPTYIGKTRWTTEDHDIYRSTSYTPDPDAMVDGKHEAIISRALWDQVQEKLMDRRNDVKYVRKNQTEIMMLKGLVRCSSCGSTLSPKREGKALQCHKYSRGACHVSHYISTKKAEEIVVDALESALETSSYTIVPKPQKKTQVHREWDKLLASEESRLKRARDAMLDGVFTTAEYAEVKAEIDENIRLLQAGKAEELHPSDVIDMDALQQRTVDALQIIKSPDVTSAAKNKALRSVLDKIVFDKAQGTLILYFIP